ncbi:uncharacterized protein LOC127137652 [Lathyrus oleraceus]|uniref:uncharacterized protein LOC127137652 n=1 Tax=Pisum sativum TaxID=3888 RepID=UPI0021CDF0B6|nr:uncharacterized protein LOC127137652 [Pisum sativum]
MYLIVLDESMGCILGQQDETDIEYHTQKAIKGSILADYLAHQPVEDPQAEQFDFPDEDIMALRMKNSDESLIEEGPEPGSIWGLVFDGAVNVYGHGIGIVIITPRGSHIPFAARVGFNCTNNIAEYEACIIGLEEAIDMCIKFIEVFGDSALFIIQIKGEWETRHPCLILYRDYSRRLSTFFTKVEFHDIPRDENQIADALATLSSMYMVNFHREVPSIPIHTRDKPAYIFNVEAVSDAKSWFFDIKCFLEKQEYPLGASNRDNKTLRRLSANLFLNGDVLYKRNFNMVFLRCVDRHEAYIC